MQHPDGKGQTWFPGKTATEKVVTYLVTWDGGYPREVSARKAAQIIRAKRMPGAELLTDMVTVERKVAYVDHPACEWCGARPQVLSIDCDGLYYTGICEDPQCGGPAGTHLPN
ncbi:hypothetical protein [Streptomyces sp. NPDC045369]|uniref:hypothetical protein n=1 Tax=Streptomyces sp. NPDC045369 TaxID=3155732 RepID=UPI0033C62066